MPSSFDSLLWRLFSCCLFLSSPSVGASGTLCFVFVAVPGYLHLYLKTHILCLLVGVVHHDCTQYTALIEGDHIKGWSYLSDFEVIIKD